MIAGSKVTGDSNTLVDTFSSYSNTINGIAGSWKGTSKDSFDQKVSDFLTYKDSISGQMSSFASACDDYITYESDKNTLKSLEARRSNGETGLDDEISSLSSEIESLRTSINSALSKAGSVKLQATANSAQVSTDSVSVDTTTATTTTGQDPNLIYSTKYDGYVFPFAKGVHAPVNSSLGKRGGRLHQGTDIGAAKGEEIRAIYSGTVVTAGEFGGYGNCVRIQQDDGYLTYYAHCSKIVNFKKGDRVNAGDVVGNVGSTGHSTGPHLHLEMRAPDYTDKNKHLANPEEIFDGVWPTT